MIVPADVEATFEEYVRRSLESLPPAIAASTENVVVRIADYADRETLRDMGIDHPLDLLGLYHGVSLDQKSVFDSGHTPDMVFLYLQPILHFARQTGQTLEAVVHHVVIHEIGHHFGFSDDDMDMIESLADDDDEA